MKYIVPVLSLLGVIVAALSPQLQAWLGSHAEIAAILIGLNGILGSIAPQPHKQMRWLAVLLIPVGIVGAIVGLRWLVGKALDNSVKH